MRHVEFLGLPGSGKTTLVTKVVAALDGAIELEDAVRSAVAAGGIDATSRTAARVSRSSSSRLWKSAYARSTDRFDALKRFLSAHPQLMETVLAAQRERRDRDRGQDLVLGWVMNLFARYQLATEAEASEFLLIDEGFCQRALALFGYGFAPEDQPRLNDYLTEMPRPEVVVLVETPLARCVERLDKRGWSERLIGLSPDVRRGFLDTSFEVLGQVADQAERLGSRVIRVDGEQPADVGSQAVVVLLAG